MARRLALLRQHAQDTGATAAEYAILVSMIAAVIVSAVFALGLQTTGLYAAVERVWP